MGKLLLLGSTVIASISLQNSWESKIHLISNRTDHYETNQFLLNKAKSYRRKKKGKN